MSKQLSQAIAEQIKKIMAARGITANGLAKNAGIPQSSLSRKLSDKDTATFDFDDVQKICAEFGIDAADLVAWAERDLRVPPMG